MIATICFLDKLDEVVEDAKNQSFVENDRDKQWLVATDSNHFCLRIKQKQIFFLVSFEIAT